MQPAHGATFLFTVTKKSFTCTEQMKEFKTNNAITYLTT